MPEAELNRIPPSRYRDNEELTIAMATDYYEPVVRWAIEELDGRNPPELERLPVLVILNSYLDIAKERVYGLFCDGGHRREFLIQGLADMDEYATNDWILRIGRFDGLTEKERELFHRMLEERTRRVELARELDIGGTFVMYSKDQEYLQQFLRGEKLEIPEWKLNPVIEDMKFTPVECG